MVTSTASGPPALPRGRVVALVAGPVLVAAMLLLRATVLAEGGPDPTIAGVAVLVVALAAGVAQGSRPAAVAVGTLPLVLAFSPSGPELAFGLARPDEQLGFLFAAGTVAAAGLCVSTGIHALAGDRRLSRPLAVLGLGLLGAAVTAGALAGAHGLEDDGVGLTAAQRSALPVVHLVDHAFASQDLDLAGLADGVERLLVLRNGTGVPHTFTVEGIDVDVYVPAGREAVLRLQLDDPAIAYCAIGDHRQLGMQVPLGA